MSSESVFNRTGAAQPDAGRTAQQAVFQPYIPASATLRELTAPPPIVGTLLGIIFGASSLYLVLKVGLTVSASIPVAVISIGASSLAFAVGMYLPISTSTPILLGGLVRWGVDTCGRNQRIKS
jgi:uncharacterized oligopeptide transporter (OPT) family protein